ncbi:MAG: peptidylprolyl isomerase [Cyanobacteria bacterium SZAS LIN-3]|nr:peptidylprolyl isomerase [Cyanobacteria bacterium SZAS LIN-3]
MKKPSLKTETAIKTMSLILVAALGLSACEAPKAGSGKTSDKGSGDKATDKNPATAGTGTVAGTASGTAAAPNQANQGPPELSDLPQLAALNNVSISKLKDSLVLCTVNGTPLTVESFKKEYRDAVLSLQAVLTSQPAKVNELLGTARSMDVKLTDEEHKKLLETARRKESLEGKAFTEFLKEKKITEAQFNEQVLMLGLAFKTGTKLIEGQLLNEMINRELLLQEARREGFYRAAMNHYIQFKHSKKYEQLVKNSSETEEQIKEEIINHEMMVMMMEKIDKEGALSDAMLKEQYEKSKEGFKHGARVRLSHIVIAAPTFDNPPLESVRTQIKRQKPNITPDELDKEEKILQAIQFNKAQALLERAKKGEDFKTMADRDSDDVPARAAKTGGDLGWIDLSLKVPGSNGGKSDQERLCDAVKDLKPGHVAPELVHTAFGWHIVKLVDRQPEGCLSFDEVKGTLNQVLSQQNKEATEQNWVKEKRKTAAIKLSDEFLRAAEEQKKAAAAATPATASTTAAAPPAGTAKGAVR